MSRLLNLDARWQRLNDPDYACPCCGRSFGGLIDIGYDAPEDWPHALPEPGAVIEAGEDRLSSELCRLGDRRFLRAHLALPVRGSEDAVHLAPWVEVAPADFYAALDRLEAGDAAPTEMAAMLANTLPGPLADMGAGQLRDVAAEARPEFLPAPGPAADLVSEGLSFDAVLDLYAEIGEDIRPHLTGRA
ncbi:hypothetical protein FIU97_07690 [Roseivivax sp. THAF40]|uniref:DUF2199 domain-containing protein n=1 Tax=unclassified Roseivivax TaxID=2639302 RepID=UPI00126960B1|nr:MULTISPECIES: DUF2199 domain-containing protein [unclassified Roseivivax]QFS82678.1 hypothetical protein FIV09_07585 [Roseivivax sp. THAF197b]QFT46447.1 hypothetical protein FIU97_07690 [Roseivivax sp. THAF40]